LDITSEDILLSLGAERSAELGLELTKPLHYGPTGVASGGELKVFQAGKYSASWYVEPITGRLTSMSVTPHHER
jgi:hypothetical protein